MFSLSYLLKSVQSCVISQTDLQLFFCLGASWFLACLQVWFNSLQPRLYLFMHVMERVGKWQSIFKSRQSVTTPRHQCLVVLFGFRQLIIQPRLIVGVWRVLLELSTSYDHVIEHGLASRHVTVDALPQSPQPTTFHTSTLHSRRDVVIINIHNTHILICYQVQTNPSAWLISDHSLSSISLSNVLLLIILATNILLLPLWMNCLKPLTYVMCLILSKKPIFIISYDTVKLFYSGYVAFILSNI